MTGKGNLKTPERDEGRRKLRSAWGGYILVMGLVCVSFFLRHGDKEMAYGAWKITRE